MMFDIFTPTLTFIIIMICLIWKYYLSTSCTVKKPLPSRRILPIIGSSHAFSQRGVEDIPSVIMNLNEKYTSPFQLWMGRTLVIFLYEPDQIKTVLQNDSCVSKSIMYNDLKPILGTGLLTTSTSPTWAVNRKIIAKIFSAPMLHEFFSIFVQESLMLTEELEKIGQSGNEIVFFQHLERCSMKISCDIMLGIKMDINMFNESLEAIRSWKDIIKYRFRNVFMFFDFTFNLTSLGRKHKNVVKLAHSLVDKMIQQWTNELNTTANRDTARTTFLDILMSSVHDEKLTQQDIFDYIFVMILTSSDTITVTMNFVIFMLANFPEIQEKVYKELSEIYGTKTPKDVPVKYEDLQHMPYLTCVIEETQRLFPVVPLFGRQLTEDLKMGDYVLPKGADVYMSLIRMHRNEKQWRNPLAFEPMRFFPENGKKPQLNYYLPFGGGSRNCVGQKYAMIAMKAILSNLVRSLIFEVNETIEIDKIKLNMNFILSTVKPLKVKITKRNVS